MEIKRENLIATLGGEEAVARMDSEAKADALEDFLSSELDKALTSTDPQSNNRSRPGIFGWE